MARIKIEDLPVLEDLTRTETKGIFGGMYPVGATEGSIDITRFGGTGGGATPIAYPNVSTATKGKEDGSTATKDGGTTTSDDGITFEDESVDRYLDPSTNNYA